MGIKLKIRFIISLAALIILFGTKGYGQGVAQQDTLKVKSVTDGTRAENAGHKSQGNAYGQSASPGNRGAVQGIKQVRGSRPDMSKARGARPPVIVRPSGSGIPKGVGKPGGAIKKGGR